MLESICYTISYHCYKKQLIEEDDIDIIRYGLELFLTQLFPFIIITLTGCLMHLPLETFSFLIIFISLRQILGGYHANRYYKCFTLTIFNYILVMILATNILISSLIGTNLLLIIGIISYHITPQYKKDNNSLKKKRKISIAVAFILIIILYIVMIPVNNIFANIILFNVLMIFFFMIVEVMKNEENKTSTNSC